MFGEDAGQYFFMGMYSHESVQLIKMKIYIFRIMYMDLIFEHDEHVPLATTKCSSNMILIFIISNKNLN